MVEVVDITEVVSTVDTLTNTFYASLALVFTVVAAVLVYVVWDKKTFKEELISEFEEKMKRTARIIILEQSYKKRYSEIEKTITLVEPPKDKKECFFVSHIPSVFLEIISIYDELKGTESFQFFENDIESYYDICETLVESLSCVNDYQTDCSPESAQKLIEELNRETLPKINRIFRRYRLDKLQIS